MRILDLYRKGETHELFNPMTHDISWQWYAFRTIKNDARERVWIIILF